MPDHATSPRRTASRAFHWLAALAALLVTATLTTPARALPTDLDTHYARFRMTDTMEASLTSPAMQQCMRRAISTVDMRDCNSTEFARVDRLLNQRYQQLMATLSPADRNRLRVSERRWLATRNNRCNAEVAEEDGGTLGLIMFDGCALTELRRRTLWLRALR